MSNNIPKLLIKDFNMPDDLLGKIISTKIKRYIKDEYGFDVQKDKSDYLLSNKIGDSIKVYCDDLNFITYGYYDRKYFFINYNDKIVCSIPGNYTRDNTECIVAQDIFNKFPMIMSSKKLSQNTTKVEKPEDYLIYYARQWYTSAFTLLVHIYKKFCNLNFNIERLNILKNKVCYSEKEINEFGFRQLYHKKNGIMIPILEKIDDKYIFYSNNFDKYKSELLSDMQNDISGGRNA